MTATRLGLPLRKADDVMRHFSIYSASWVIIFLRKGKSTHTILYGQPIEAIIEIELKNLII